MEFLDIAATGIDRRVIAFSLLRRLFGLTELFPQEVHEAVMQVEGWIAGRQTDVAHESTDVRVHGAVGQFERGIGAVVEVGKAGIVDKSLEVGWLVQFAGCLAERSEDPGIIGSRIQRFDRCPSSEGSLGYRSICCTQELRCPQN